MMHVIFCMVVDVASVVCIAWIGYLIAQGATAWLVIAMLAMALRIVVPGDAVYKCPECGHSDNLKAFFCFGDKPDAAVKEKD